VQTTPQGKCFYSSDTYINGASGDPYLNQNIWAGDTSYKQVLYGASPEDWYVIANANTNFGGVLTFPNVGFNMSGAVDSKSSLTSSFSTSFAHDAKVAAWAAYDLWFNDWADEVMIQTDISAPDYYNCDAVASATFGGMPWHMCRFDAERVWKPGTDDNHLINQASGTVDIQAMLEWMEQNGQLPAGSVWTASSFGFEVCDTGGTDVKFWANAFTWTAR
jgi:hypothetical protein